MIDSAFKPWLIEVNTNPCLEVEGTVLSRIIPNLVENVIRIAIDPIFPPPLVWPKSRRGSLTENLYEHNRFELLFDCSRDRDVVFE